MIVLFTYYITNSKNGTRKNPQNICVILILTRSIHDQISQWITWLKNIFCNPIFNLNFGSDSSHIYDTVNREISAALKVGKFVCF
jgi:hypothetical protein